MQSSSRPFACHFAGIGNRLALNILSALAAVLFTAPTLAATLIVTSAADSGPGSLREAVAIANERRGHDIIEFDSNLGAIELSSGQIEITEDLTLRAAAAGQLINGMQGSRILAVTRESATLRLENLTLTGARTNRPGVFNDCSARWGQGAALCSLGDVTLIASTISHNLTTGDAAHGAGLYVRGRLLASASTISNNRTLGPMAHGGGLSVFGSADIVDSFIANNVASGRLSAGAALSGRGEIRITDTQVSGNLGWSDEKPVFHLGSGTSLSIDGTQPDGNFSSLDRNRQPEPVARTALSRLETRVHPNPDNQDQTGLIVSFRADETIGSEDEWTRGYTWCGHPDDLQQPVSIDFGTAAIGATTANWILTISNPGSVTTVIDSLTLIGSHPGDFNIISDACTSASLPQGSDCEVRLNATPQANGLRTAALGIDSVPNSRSVGLRVTGDSPSLEVSPGTVNFGEVQVGQSEVASVTLSNPNNVAIAVSDIGTVSAPFERSGGSCATGPFNLPAGEDCTLEYRFSPTIAGAVNQEVTISADGENPSFGLQGTGTAPVFEINLAAIDFGSLPVGSSGPTETIQISNGGNADLSIGSLTVAGDHPGDFQLASDDCSNQTLAPATQCAVSISVELQAAGPRSARIDFASNAPDSPHSVSLDAEGLVGELELSTTLLDFGTVAVGDAGTLVLTVGNTGTWTLEVNGLSAATAPFARAGGDCPDPLFMLDAGEHCSLAYDFTPAERGPVQQTIMLATSVGQAEFSLEGTGLAPVLELDVNSIDFGEIEIGTSNSETLAILNTGELPLVLQDLIISGTDADAFALMTDDCSGQTVLPSLECTVTVTATPSSAASLAAQIDIPSNALSTPDSVTLAAVGTQAAIGLSPDTLDFGLVRVGQAGETLVLSVGNTGTTTLIVSSLSKLGAPFEMNGGSCGTVPFSVVVDQSCTLEFSFIPNEAGGFDQELVFGSNAGDDAVASLVGEGIEPQLSLDADSVDFGSVVVGNTSAAELLTLENSGSAELVLGSVGLAGDQAAEFDMAEDTCSGQTLAPGSSCILALTVTPNGTGSRSAVLEINSDAASSPDSIGLFANGIQAALSLSATEIHFGEVEVGTDTDSQTLIVENIGSAEMDVDTLLLVGLDVDDFQIVQDGCTAQALTPGDVCLIELTASPTAPGPLQAVLEISSSAADSPAMVELTATGVQAVLSLDSPALNLGLVSIGTTSNGLITLSNSGSGVLQLQDVRISSEPFAFDGGTCLPVPTGLEASESCTLAIRFAPVESGEFSALVEIDSNAPTSPDHVELSGQAIHALPVPLLNIGSLLILALLTAGIGWLTMAGRRS